MQTPGSSFLHERNPNLHTSAEVEHVTDYLRENGENIPNEPTDKISAHLGFLANRNYVNDGVLTGDQISIDRQIEANVIKAQDVPEGYFELQRRIAREQGHGDVQIDSEMRKQLIEAVQADQRAGLGRWVEYLGGADGGYPDWFKNYTWGSVTKLGAYDKNKGDFKKRSSGTTSTYPELNREALAYVFDALDKSRIQGEQVDGGANNDQLQKLLKGGNFGRLYAHAMLEVTPDSPELRNDIRGSWTAFSQTDDPRTARRLANSLQGHGTGWCTAGESTASKQLRSGDFFVYYTRDEEGKDTVPRVAIRMERGEVAEVRGVDAAQELEPRLADITSERLQDLPGGESYIRKAEDMKQLTAIEATLQQNPDAPLSVDDLRFMYELDRNIEGFGYKRDPRVDALRTLRGERDMPELVHVFSEIAREQLKSAYAGYRDVMQQLSSETIATDATTEQLFVDKDKEWLAAGVYDYVLRQFMDSGLRHHLAITPNVNVDSKQIKFLAQQFREDQPHTTYVDDEMYGGDFYSAQELSGATGTHPVRFSLIPDSLNPEFNGTIEEGLQKLHAKNTTPGKGFSFHVPSMLEAITNWYALRARGDKLMDQSAVKKTNVLHFDLEPRKRDGQSSPRVPHSVINGGPGLYGESVLYGKSGLVALG